MVPVLQHPGLNIPSRLFCAEAARLAIRSGTSMSASFADLKRAAVEQSRRKLSRIELMIHEFSLYAAELDGVVASEEARVGIFDPKHFAYPCYAKAVAQR